MIVKTHYPQGLQVLDMETNMTLPKSIFIIYIFSMPKTPPPTSYEIKSVF